MPNRYRSRPIAELIGMGLILGAFGAAVIGDATGTFHCPQHRDGTQREIEQIVAALEAHHLAHGVYPTEDEGLAALADYFQSGEVPRDFWGYDYLYRRHPDGGFEVLSLGRDNAPGGSGEDSDISSLTLSDLRPWGST